jgi:NTE family protein
VAMRVLILGGGGTLGAFSAGALQALEQSAWTPEVLIGSSAGSINLLRYLVGGGHAAVDFWTGLRWTKLVKHGLFHSMRLRGILDPKSFNAHVDEAVDFERMFHDPRNLAFIVVDLNTGKVKIRGNRTEKSAEDLRVVAHGSYALPPLLPPIPLGDALLADGGLLINAPLDSAIKLGATEIVYLCNVQVLPRESKLRKSTLKATLRYADIFVRRASNVGFADAELKEGNYRGVPFVAIAPPSYLRLDSILSWMIPKEGAMDHLVKYGHASAERAIAQTSWLSRSADGATRVAVR